MNPLQVLALAGVIVVAPPIAPIKSDTDISKPPTTWHCKSRSTDGTITADVKVDIHGKADLADVTWSANVGDGFPIYATEFGFFSKDAPKILGGHMLILTPDLSDKQSHDALRGHRFQWTISTHAGSGDDYPKWYVGLPAFSGEFTTLNSHRDSDHPSLQFDADDFAAMIRGSDQLFLVARDKNAKALLRRRLLVGTMRTWPILAQKVAQQATDLTLDYLNSCVNDDNGEGDIVV